MSILTELINECMDGKLTDQIQALLKANDSNINEASMDWDKIVSLIKANLKSNKKFSPKLNINDIIKLIKSFKLKPIKKTDDSESFWFGMYNYPDSICFGNGSKLIKINSYSIEANICSPKYYGDDFVYQSGSDGLYHYAYEIPIDMASILWSIIYPMK